MCTSTSTSRNALRAVLRWGPGAVLFLLLGAAGPARAQDAATLAKQGQTLAEQSCGSDGYDAKACANAVDMLQRAVQKDPRLIDARLALAQATWNSAFTHGTGDPQRTVLKQRGLRLYRELVDENVKDARPYRQLAGILREDAERVPLLEKAVKLAPKDPEAHRELADAYVGQGRVDDAVRTYQAGAAQQPKLGAEAAADHVQLAKKLEAAGRPEAAAKVYEHVVDASTHEPRERRCQLVESVQADRAKGQGALAQKLASLRSFCPKSLEHRDRAAQLERQGKKDDAAKELERQVQETPKHEESYLSLQRIYAEKGEPARAAQVSDRLLRMEKDPAEKCRLFRQLDPRSVAALDARTADALRGQCGKTP